MGCRKFGSYLAVLVVAVGLTFLSAAGQSQPDLGFGAVLSGQQNQSQTSNGSGSQSPDNQSLDQSQTRYDGLPQSGLGNGAIHSNVDSRRDLQNGSNPAPDDPYKYDPRTGSLNTTRLLNQLPPDPPTEFQRLVQDSIGRMLPLYGATLFLNSPSTFAPLDRVPVTPDYVVGPGDELLIQVWGQITLNSRFTVDRAGNIFIPQVGTVRVAGLPFAKLQSYIQSEMARVFRNFELNVNMGQLRSIQIFVVGQARRPGSYTVSSLSTLVNALFVTGGPTPQGSLRHIQLKRSGQIIVDFDLYDLLQNGDKSKDASLLPGDVIYIPPVGPQIAVAGSVNAPAIYELKSATESTIEDVLKSAAGPSSVAANSTVRLERIDAHTMRSVTEVSLDSAGRATPLRDGDIVELVAVSNRFSNGVTLRGNVANPGHYSWKPGMRVRDLFPDKDALITRDYWLRRGRLGEPALQYTPDCLPAAAGNRSTGALPNSQGTRSSSDCLSPPRAGTSQTGADTYGRLNQEGSRTGTDGMASGSSSTAAAAVSSTNQTFEVRNQVTLSAPDIDWSYAVIERQSQVDLLTSLLPFNLGSLVLQGDPSQNLELQAGDVVTIFSKADIRVPQSQQTRFVHLEGEFRSPGVYSVLPGETLQQLIVRAGGLTTDAYLYGAEFTRESTRRVQQQRLNDYVQQLSLQVSTNSANLASRNVSVIDTAAAVARQSQDQGILNNLRQARSSGRIVLNVKEDSKDLSQIGPLAMEDGDTFIVPSTPSTVSVAGAVYNPNSFLFTSDMRVGRSLGLAGGANRQADAKRAYIIRADGSVISKQQMSFGHRGGFKSVQMYPGDTLVVPLNLERGGSLRNIVDIAQIVGQFGLAIAAANIVF